MEKTIQLYESTTIAHNYSKYCPTYPEELATKIVSFANRNGIPGKTMAVDLGCGSGQSTFQLCSYFNQTVGIDISKAQIECAQKRASTLLYEKVRFVHCPASELPFRNASVDLINCGAAWHWLDPSAVFPEINRVLKENGIVAVFGYGIPRVCHKQCEEYLCFYFTNNMFWHETQHGNMKTILDSLYRNVKLPYSLLERYDYVKKSTTTLEWIQGFIRSTGAYEAYCKLHPESTALQDILKTMRKILLEGKRLPDESVDLTPFSDVFIDIEIPFYLLLTSKNGSDV